MGTSISDKVDPIDLLIERREAIREDLKVSKTYYADAMTRATRATEEAAVYTAQIAKLTEALAKLGYVEPGQEVHAP
jgi:hypothetical protein